MKYVYCLFGYYKSYHHYFLEGIYTDSVKANNAMKRYRKRTKRDCFICEFKLNIVRKVF